VLLHRNLAGRGVGISTPKSSDWMALVLGITKINLVGGLEHEFYFSLFFHILGISSSQLTNSYFSEG